MFLHILKYELLTFLRAKQAMFWMLFFPIILGSMFYFAFGNLYEENELVSEIPVAVVENKTNENFNTVIKEISSGKDALFDVTYTNKEDALEKLSAADITGIIFVDDEISLSVSADGLSPTILKSFLEQYKINETIITDIAKKNPQNISAVVEQMSKQINPNTEKTLSNGNMDVHVQYFNNLFAMACLYGCIAGLHVVVSNQGNLSKLGARKGVAPTHKMKSILACLLSAIIVQFACSCIHLFYVLKILKINMGDRIAPMFLIVLVGGITGITFGFFVGSIGKMTEGFKVGILMGVTMTCCFLSGLMVGNMRPLVEKYCPIVNRINPAALISDCFYSLNIYDTYDRLNQNLITLLIISGVFIVGGFLMTRRQKYASI